MFAWERTRIPTPVDSVRITAFLLIVAFRSAKVHLARGAGGERSFCEKVLAGDALRVRRVSVLSRSERRL